MELRRVVCERTKLKILPLKCASHLGSDLVTVRLKTRQTLAPASIPVKMWEILVIPYRRCGLAATVGRNMQPAIPAPLARHHQSRKLRPRPSLGGYGGRGRGQNRGRTLVGEQERSRFYYNRSAAQSERVQLSARSLRQRPCPPRIRAILIPEPARASQCHAIAAPIQEVRLQPSLLQAWHVSASSPLQYLPARRAGARLLRFLCSGAIEADLA
jgi:hypothetical protein